MLSFGVLQDPNVLPVSPPEHLVDGHTWSCLTQPMKRKTSRSTPHLPPPPPETIEIEALYRLLDLSPHPINARRVHAEWPSPSRPPLDRIEELLAWLISSGRSCRYAGGDSKEAPRYWTRPPEQLTRQVILEQLRDRWLTLAELKRRLKGPLRGVSDRLQQEVLRELQREGLLHRWPPLLGTRTPLFSCLPPNPELYLSHALTSIAKQLSIPRPQLEQTVLGMISAPSQLSVTGREAPLPLPAGAHSNSLASHSHQRARVLERIIQVKLATQTEGTPLLFFALWESLRTEGWEKIDFDQVILHLGRQDRFQLLVEDHPTLLPPEQRHALVVDPEGILYRAIQRR
jgi:hypothetical protein